jgi:hypothetical protein
MEETKKIDEPVTEQPVEDNENADQEKKKKKKKNKKKTGATGDDYDAELAKVCDEQKVDAAEETKDPVDGEEEGGDADPAKKKKKRSK